MNGRKRVQLEKEEGGKKLSPHKRKECRGFRQRVETYLKMHTFKLVLNSCYHVALILSVLF